MRERKIQPFLCFFLSGCTQAHKLGGQKFPWQTQVTTLIFFPRQSFTSALLPRVSSTAARGLLIRQQHGLSNLSITHSSFYRDHRWSINTRSTVASSKKTFAPRSGGKTMAFVPHFQAFSTGQASGIERNIIEGNSVLHDREGETLTSPTGKLCPFSRGSPGPARRVSCDAFEAADLSGKCHKQESSARPVTYYYGVFFYTVSVHIQQFSLPLFFCFL